MTVFHGLKTGSVQNQNIRLDYLLEGGLRIIRLLLPECSSNFLAETPDFGWETPFGWYHLRGGHRLWVAPQHPKHTSVPETQPIKVEQQDGLLRLVQPVDANTGISKMIEVQLMPDRPGAVIRHQLNNEGLWPAELSAWAITQVPLGGRIILPQADPPAETKGAGPDRHLVFWPYNCLPDDRLDIQNRYLIFDVQQGECEFKMGTYTPKGWIGYAWENHFFRKQFFPKAGQIYPDLGSNVEIYCNHHFAEIETLSPLCRLEAGDSIEHTEIWEFFTLDEAQDLLEIEDRCFPP